MPSSLVVLEDPLVMGVIGAGGGAGVVLGDSATFMGSFWLLFGDKEFLRGLVESKLDLVGDWVDNRDGVLMFGKKGWKGADDTCGMRLGKMPPCWAFKTFGRLCNKLGLFIHGFCPLVIAKQFKENGKCFNS